MTESNHSDENLITGYAHGAVNAAERRTIEAHLADCVECRQEVLQLHRILGADRRRTAIRYVSIAATAAAAAVVFLIAVPQGGRRGATDEPALATVVGREPGQVVTTQWLAVHASDPAVVVLHIDSDLPLTRGPRFADGHIPGARDVQYAAIICEKDHNGVELPPTDSLRSFFESQGVSDSTRVILTGHPVAVVRAYLTLTYLGLTRVSVLDGGTTKWRQEGRPIAEGASALAAGWHRGRISVRPDPDVIVTRDYMLSHIGKPGVSFVDTRTTGEYVGQATWKGVRSTGHIQGARQIDWQDYFQNDSDVAFKPRADLERLISARVAVGDTVVAYCFNGGRSSSTFFVARLLGRPAKLYDGSYQDWAEHHLPTVVTPTPPVAD